MAVIGLWNSLLHPHKIRRISPHCYLRFLPALALSNSGYSLITSVCVMYSQSLAILPCTMPTLSATCSIHPIFFQTLMHGRVIPQNVVLVPNILAPKLHMSAFSWSFTSLSTRKHATPLSRIVTRCVTRQYTALPKQLVFEALGVSQPVANALREAFPNVQVPTITQTEFIPAILNGKDVLLKDKTGSGK